MRNKGSYRKNVLFRWLLGIMIVMIIFSGLLNLYFMGFAAITTAGREMADTLCLEEIIAINDNLDGEKLKEAWAGKEKKDEIIQLNKQLSDFLEKYTYKDKQGRIKCGIYSDSGRKRRSAVRRRCLAVSGRGKRIYVRRGQSSSRRRRRYDGMRRKRNGDGPVCRQ